MLAEEFVGAWIPKQMRTLANRIQGTASNIKSRVNRQSVLSAITSTQQRLKLYNKVPTNGLVVYVCLTIPDKPRSLALKLNLESAII